MDINDITMETSNRNSLRLEDISYSKQPRKQKFHSKSVEELIYYTLKKHLKGKRYKNENVEIWCHDIACDIKDALLDQGLTHYKLACEVVIGENQGTSLKVSSACFWDEEDDRQATQKYVTDELVSMAVVFACRNYNK
jgi:hypothetical protein